MQQNKPSGTSAFRVLVLIPDNVNPGDKFQVYVGNCIVSICCPTESCPGQWLSITLPVEYNNTSENILPWRQPSVSHGLHVRIPEKVNPGDELKVNVGNCIVHICCPLESRPGQQLYITLPVENNPTPENILPLQQPPVETYPGM